MIAAGSPALRHGFTIRLRTGSGRENWRSSRTFRFDLLIPRSRRRGERSQLRKIRKEEDKTWRVRLPPGRWIDNCPFGSRPLARAVKPADRNADAEDRKRLTRQPVELEQRNLPAFALSSRDVMCSRFSCTSAPGRIAESRINLCREAPFGHSASLLTARVSSAVAHKIIADKIQGSVIVGFLLAHHLGPARTRFSGGPSVDCGLRRGPRG